MSIASNEITIFMSTVIKQFLPRASQKYTVSYRELNSKVFILRF